MLKGGPLDELGEFVSIHRRKWGMHIERGWTTQVIILRASVIDEHAQYHKTVDSFGAKKD